MYWLKSIPTTFRSAAKILLNPSPIAGKASIPSSGGRCRATLTSSLLMRSGVNTKSTFPEAMALWGMPSNLADASSWAKVMPPSALIAAKPAVPSEPLPERITPMA
ncbi:MAG: hypothetical protein WAM66_01230 [Acidobacteriaceae bacterium]